MTDEEETLFKAMEGQFNNALILHDGNNSANLPNIPVSTHLEYLATSTRHKPNETPFVFYQINELYQLAQNKISKRKQVKTCGIYKMTKHRAYLVEPYQCEKDDIKLDVDFELVGDLPPVGRMIEVFGYLTFDESNKRVVFNAWFWRERTGSYNLMVELYLKHRLEFQENNGILKN